MSDADRLPPRLWWVLAGLTFADITPAVRLGLEWAHFIDTYGDGVHGLNDRGQFSAFYIF